MKPTDELNIKALRYLEKQLGKVRFGFSMARKKAGVSSRELDNLRGKEEVLNWLVRVVKGLGNRPPAAEWISVEDRLPDGEDPVLIFVKETEHYGFHKEKRKVYYCQYLAYADDYEVTHWMPLPEPPKESRP